LLHVKQTATVPDNMDCLIMRMSTSLQKYLEKLIVIPCIMGILNHILVERQVTNEQRRRRAYEINASSHGHLWSRYHGHEAC
jgi:hypothetical protein